ncbi:phage tail domain-containing protein [Bacillus cihuensis]|uniref:phage tail domain-containing protein n=1 Tax=Bacillus cihuensis TaxID=1208599 RepID=UPI0003F9B012|nr:phage tail domain-containing protein [Bacillus cihuensis]
MILLELNGNKIDLKAFGITPLKLIIDSLSPRNESETVEGMDGHIDLETTYDGRTMSASFFIRSAEDYNYSQLQSLVYRLFNGKTYFYVIDDKELHKRWKVRSAEKYTVEKLSWNAGTFTINLVSPSPYAESLGTTLRPGISDYYFGVGKGKIDEGDPTIRYVFTEKSFAVFNDSDVIVDPRNKEHIIEFEGASTNLSIKNLTTGDEWIYTGSTTPSDVIRLDGIRSFKNSSSIFGQTNHKLITLEEGWNYFEITGATDFTISFDFRFYYI